MGSRDRHELSFEVNKVIQPIYTGGSVSLDTSGKILAACVGEDALITRLDDGEALCRIEGDGEALTSLELSPDAKFVVLCSRSLSMRIYSLLGNESSDQLEVKLLKAVKPHKTPVVSTCIDHTSTLLATGSADGAIKVWDIRGGYTTHTFTGHSGIVSVLRFFEAVTESSSHKVASKRVASSNSNDFIALETADEANTLFRLASGGDDGQIRIWDLVKRKSLASLTSHVSVVRGLDFNSAQNALISCSRDKTFITWDARTWKIRKVVPALEVLEDLVFVKDGAWICTGGENGYIRVWHTDSGKEITTEQEVGSDANTIVRLLNLPSADRLMSINAEQTLVLHRLDILSSLNASSQIDEVPLVRRISGTHDEVIDLAYITPSRRLLALSTNSENVRLVCVSNNETKGDDVLQFGSDVGLLQGHEDIVICLDTDWSGCWLATGGKDNVAKLWRIDSGSHSFECHATFTGHTESLGAISVPKTAPQTGSAAYTDPLSQPPSFLITGSQDKTIKRWSIGSLKANGKGPKAVYTRKAHEKDINAISINHNGTLFASASQDRLVKIWSVEEGEVQGILKGHKRGVWSVAFAPKDTPTILGDDSSRSSGGRGVVLTGSGDKTVKIWSLSDYSCLRTFEGHTNTVLKVLWLPQRFNHSDEGSERKGTDLASSKQPAIAVSAGSDGLVRLWDAQTGESSAILDNHTDRIWALAAHPTDGTVVSGGADSVVTFWKDVTASAAAARANAAAQRVEQEQELSNHLHRGNYREAIVLALTLNHPGRLLALFTSIAKNDPEERSLSGLKAVDEVIASLSDDQLYTLLLRLRDWNTNARTAHVAQRMFRTVVSSYPRERIIGLAKGKGRRGLGDVLEALRVYTERHYKRMEELLEESYIVDFVVRSMGEEGFVEDKEEARDISMVVV